MYKSTIIALGCIIVLVVLSGCGKPPEAEIQNAQTAIDACQAAEAQTYAPDAFKAAMDAFNGAKAAKEEQDAKFVLFRAYGKVRDLYVNSEDMADKATAEAEVQKEKVKAEVGTLLEKAQSAIDAASLALINAPKGKGNKADLELIKSDIATTQNGLNDANGLFGDEKFFEAKAKAEVVIDKANAIIAEIEKAKGMKGK